MKKITVEVTDDVVTLIQEENIIENQINMSKLNFEFDESWAKYNKYVVFQDEKTNRYKVSIIDNEAIVPSSLSNGFVSFQIYGDIIVDGVIQERKPSLVSGIVITESLKNDGVEIEVPTPDEWDIYINQIQDIVNTIITEEKERAEAEDGRVNAETKREEYISNLKRDVSSGNLDGATFIPSVDKDGNLSWKNNKKLENPEIINIKGPKGDCNFATFEVNFKTGQLEMTKGDNLENIEFAIVNGNLEVEING